MMGRFPALLVGGFAASGRTIFAGPSTLALAEKVGVGRKRYAALRTEGRELIIPEALLNTRV